MIYKDVKGKKTARLVGYYLANLQVPIIDQRLPISEVRNNPISNHSWNFKRF